METHRKSYPFGNNQSLSKVLTTHNRFFFFCFRLAFHTTINQLSENQHLVSFPRNNEAMRSTKISNLMITVPGLYQKQFYRRSTTSIRHRHLILYEKNLSTGIELLQIKSIHAYLAKT